MQEEENITQAEGIAEMPPDPRAAEKARNAARARERYARLRDLGLSARGNPLKKKNRDAAKQRRYQANHARKEKAARKRLGLTIAEFKKLPTATRLMELNYGAERGSAEAERNRARQRAWYHKNKASKAAPTINNGVRATVDRTVNLCPHCGWNINAMRKAQAFVDGEVA